VIIKAEAREFLKTFPDNHLINNPYEILFGHGDCTCTHLLDAVTITTGCIRIGIDVWQIGEIILVEISGISARRRKDRKTAFELLEVV
jgi:predicted DNA-binding protein with PD1-like motif